MKTSASNAGGGPPPPPQNAQNSGAPDAQAKEKLAIYVYEYLVHSGASKSAETFLQEMWRDKSIRISSAPGFLQAWWNVFWDLYSAAPEHRDDLPCSSEARAMYDYGLIQSGGMLTGPPHHHGNPPGMMPGGPPPDGMGPGGGPMQLQGAPPHHQFYPGAVRPGGGPPHQQLVPRFGPMSRPVMRHPPGHDPPYSTAGHQPPHMFSPNDGMPPGPGMMQPGHRFPPMSAVPLAARVQMMGVPPGGPQGPPHGSDTFRAWPNTSLSPSMANGPPPSASTPIMPSPQSGPLPPRSVGTPGPGSVPVVSSASGSGGPVDVPTSMSLSPDYMPTMSGGSAGNPGQGGGGSNERQGAGSDGGSGSGGPGGGGEEDQEAIMRIKQSLGEEARCFESGEPGSGDYSFMPQV